MLTPTLGWTRSKKASRISLKTAFLHSQDALTHKFKGSYIYKYVDQAIQNAKRKVVQIVTVMHHINMSATNMLSLNRLDIFCMYFVAQVVNLTLVDITKI